MRPDKIKTAPFILWIENGGEGWTPYLFDSIVEISKFIQDGSCHGPSIITRQVKFEFSGNLIEVPPKS